MTFADDDAVSYGVVDEIAKRVLLTGGRVLAVRARTARRPCRRDPPLPALALLQQIVVAVRTRSVRMDPR